MDTAALRPGPDGLLRRAALRADGFGADEIDRLLRTGVLRPVRRGVYRLAPADGADPADRSPEMRHAVRARAAGPGLCSGAAFGYVTAAVLLGLPLWGFPLDLLHVIRDRRNGARRRGDLHVHAGRLPESDVLLLDGLRVTSAARTVVDLARTAPVEQALVALDGAVHTALVVARTGSRDPGAATPEEIADVLGRAARTSGAPGARRVLALADGRSESPGETRSRYRMHLAGLPPPITQWTVPGTRYRTDFAWPDLGVVGEFDGREKYGRTPGRGDSPERVVWREKRREDDIRVRGFLMVRWTWSEIDDHGRNGMAARLRERLGG